MPEPVSFLNCFSMAEVECATILADAIGLEVGRTAFIGPAIPYPNCMAFEFAGSNPNDSSYLSAHSMLCVPMNARAMLCCVNRDAVWQNVARAVNALPKRNPTAHVELFRIASIGQLTPSDYQFPNEKAPRTVWTCNVTFNVVVLTGGKEQEA